MPDFQGTRDPEVNELLRQLLEQVRAILGDALVGMYLEGSLAHGEFDRDSDIDFVVVCTEEVNDAAFLALQAMHRHIAALDCWCANQLEGTYISRQALRRYDPVLSLHPNLSRGSGEQLEWVRHDQTWDIHRFVLREKGLRLTGPELATLIDPVSPDDLRRTMRTVLQEWAGSILAHPEKIQRRGYQSYVVLTLCRTLYTLEFGDIVSKPKALRWARAALEPRWQGLIGRAWTGRQLPGEAADLEDIHQTVEFIHYTQGTAADWNI